MKFMVIVKANKDSEAGVLPTTDEDYGLALTKELSAQRAERRRSLT